MYYSLILVYVAVLCELLCLFMLAKQRHFRRQFKRAFVYTMNLAVANMRLMIN